MYQSRQLALDYQAAAAEHTGPRKLSSANWFNHEHVPLDENLPNEATILSVYPFPTLHAKLGVMNDLYDTLDDILLAYDGPFRAVDWAESISITRESYYGGKAVFNGPDCNKLLNNIQKLKDLATIHNLTYLDCIIYVFDTFHRAVQSCFGNVLHENRYKDDIREYSRAFFQLKAQCNEINMLKKPPKKVHCSCTPKVHGTFVHVRQTLEGMKERYNVSFGAGLYSEQR